MVTIMITLHHGDITGEAQSSYLEVLHEAVLGVEHMQEVLAGLLVGGVHHGMQPRPRH